MSISNETGSITLAGKTFPVQAFTFVELQVMLPIFLRISTEAGRDFAVSASREILHVALVGRSLLTEDEFNALGVTLPEIKAAVEIVADVTGLPRQGEAKAPAATS